MRLLFVGPPGSGKGTQCEVLSQALGVPHISTGELLRDAVRAGGIAGRRAQHFMSAGRLVPDRLVLRLLEARLAQPDAQKGYLLDGFPRTIPQARRVRDAPGCARLRRHRRARAPRSVVLDRLAARGRGDDSKHSVQRRLDIFERVTVPMIAWLAERYPLIKVAADRPVEVVTAEILRRLGELHADDPVDTVEPEPPTASVGPAATFGPVTAAGDADAPEQLL